MTCLTQPQRKMVLAQCPCMAATMAMVDNMLDDVHVHYAIYYPRCYGSSFSTDGRGSRVNHYL